MDDWKTIEDILRFAIIEEQEAVNLYKDLAKSVEDFKLKTMLEQLARDEMRHKVILTKILERKSYDIEHKSIDSLLFRLKESKPVIYDKNNRLSEIFNLAIRKELDAANLYKDMALYFQNSYISGLLISLAEEELMHKKNLEMDLEYLKTLY